MAPGREGFSRGKIITPGTTAGSASAWQRFSTLVDVLYEQDIMLFLVGHGPLDWDAAGDPARRTGSRQTSVQPVDLARIASRLALLGRVEAPEPFEEVEAAGS